MDLTGETTLMRLAFAEVDGKNKAIHAYDQMIWTVRSGFVTLFFAGWGLLFKELLIVERFLWLHAGIFGALVVVSGMLAYAAHSIERNYARRKFRVIGSLNALMRQLEQSTMHAESLAPSLRVAGDADTGDPDTPGFQSECSVGRLIYGLSLLAALLGLALVLVGATIDGRLGNATRSAGAQIDSTAIRSSLSEPRILNAFPLSVAARPSFHQHPDENGSGHRGSRT